MKIKKMLFSLKKYRSKARRINRSLKRKLLDYPTTEEVKDYGRRQQADEFEEESE